VPEPVAGISSGVVLANADADSMLRNTPTFRIPDAILYESSLHAVNVFSVMDGVNRREPIKSDMWCMCGFPHVLCGKAREGDFWSRSSK